MTTTPSTTSDVPLTIPACKACFGRGIVANAKGDMQVCPLCGGSGSEYLPPKGVQIWCCF